MKKLKLISLLCSLIMVISCFSIFPAFADETAYNYQGSGTIADPYILTNANFADFMETAKTQNAFKSTAFKLGEDIVLNNGANDGTAADWAAGTVTPTTVLTQPIINYDYVSVFDGDGYSISGICMIAGEGVTEVGLFQRLSYGQLEGTFVKNLRVVNSYFEMSSNTENSAMGSIAAGLYYNANIVNCYSDAILTNKAAAEATSKVDSVAVGGIAGSLALTRSNFMGYYWCPSVNNCVFAGSILDNLGATGGIIGWVPDCDQDANTTEMTISNCLNLGSVNSSVSGANVSAIVGGVQYKEDYQKIQLKIENCMNLSTNVPSDVLGNENHQHVNGTAVVVNGLRQKDSIVYPGNTTKWVTAYDLSTFLNGEVTAIAGWNRKEGCIPNPTTHTDIPLSAIINAETLGLQTTGDIHSVRISTENKGLRFETFVSDTGVTLLDELKKVEGATVAMNTYISAGKYFTDDQDGITEFTAKALGENRYLKVEATEFLRKNGNGDNTFAGSVVKINDVTMNYIAVGCVTVTIGDATYDIYADWNTDEITSVSAVATAAANDTKTDAGVEGYDNLITDINDDEVYSPYTQAQYDCIKSLMANA